MKAQEGKKIINIATPAVWTDAAAINQYIEKLDRLIEDTNTRLSGKEFKIGEVMIDAYTEMDPDIFQEAIRCPRYFKVACYARATYAINGMGYCWYKSVDRAFGGSSFEEVNRVLYYPVDASFERSHNNTISDPDKMVCLLQVLQEGNIQTEQLVMGNYTSSDDKKNGIEAIIRLVLAHEFPNLIPEMTRVRSEYWGISPTLFANFKAFYFSNIHQKDDIHPVKDPSLLVLIYCLCRDKKIIPCDLGYYKEENVRAVKKRKNQILRAVKLIYYYLQEWGSKDCVYFGG